MVTVLAWQVWARHAHILVQTSSFKPIFTDQLFHLIHNICYPESSKFSTKVTQYGCENEKRATEAYKARMVGKN